MEHHLGEVLGPGQVLQRPQLRAIRSADHGEGRASARGLILAARAFLNIHLRCRQYLVGQQSPTHALHWPLHPRMFRS